MGFPNMNYTSSQTHAFLSTQKQHTVPKLLTWQHPFFSASCCTSTRSEGSTVLIGKYLGMVTASGLQSHHYFVINFYSQLPQSIKYLSGFWCHDFNGSVSCFWLLKLNVLNFALSVVNIRLLLHCKWTCRGWNEELHLNGVRRARMAGYSFLFLPSVMPSVLIDFCLSCVKIGIPASANYVQCDSND